MYQSDTFSVTLPRIHREPRSAFTIIELLVAITLTLILMGVVAQVFSLVGETVTNNRSIIEMIDRHRSATDRMQSDLQGHTVHTLPWRRAEASEGYIVLYEGPARDANPERASFVQSDPRLMELVKSLDGHRSMVMGDVDDVLALTTRSRGAPLYRPLWR